MEKKHRQAIQVNFSSLVEQTDLDAMVSKLYEKEVFSERMIEPYKDTKASSRERKRALYLHVQRRGPLAFKHLLDSLMELGLWGLAQDLDPNNSHHAGLRVPTNPTLIYNTSDPRNNESECLSISEEKRKSKKNTKINKTQALPEYKSENISQIDSTSSATPTMPNFSVVKSTRFYDDNPEKVYETRGKKSVLLLFNYTEFPPGAGDRRDGAEVDCNNLKHLFGEMGFTVRVYQNIGTEDTKAALENRANLIGVGCVFVVVMSHGYPSPRSSDTDIRCSDGGIISTRYIVDQFNNDTFPDLRGVPKVFIFQLCRGYEGNDHKEFRVEADINVYDKGMDPDGPESAAQPTPSAVKNSYKPSRRYSDILIVYSTVPGFVSRRDTTLGSWYIQVLWEVFAESAHNTDVLQLFQKVDVKYENKFHIATSDTVNWGFNKLLYLHPGFLRTQPSTIK